MDDGRRKILFYCLVWGARPAARQRSPAGGAGSSCGGASTARRRAPCAAARAPARGTHGVPPQPLTVKRLGAPRQGRSCRARRSCCSGASTVSGEGTSHASKRWCASRPRARARLQCRAENSAAVCVRRNGLGAGRGDCAHWSLIGDLRRRLLRSTRGRRWRVGQRTQRILRKPSSGLFCGCRTRMASMNA